MKTKKIQSLDGQIICIDGIMYALMKYNKIPSKVKPILTLSIDVTAVTNPK
jgi:hypothetical protein